MGGGGEIYYVTGLIYVFYIKHGSQGIRFSGGCVIFQEIVNYLIEFAKYSIMYLPCSNNDRLFLIIFSEVPRDSVSLAIIV